MFTSSIGWILIVTGIITAGGGLVALLSPNLFLRLGFGDGTPSNAAVLFVRHWGVLISVVAGLIVYSAQAPAIRGPVLIAAIVEKFAIGLLVFFGPVKRTAVMTAIAIGDGSIAVLYVAYLVGR